MSKLETLLHMNGLDSEKAPTEETTIADLVEALDILTSIVLAESEEEDG